MQLFQFSPLKAKEIELKTPQKKSELTSIIVTYPTAAVVQRPFSVQFLVHSVWVFFTGVLLSCGHFNIFINQS